MVKRLLENEMVAVNNLSLDYGFNQAKKSMKSLNDIISSIGGGEYNQDFITEMNDIGQEDSIRLNNLEDLFSD